MKLSTLSSSEKGAKGEHYKGFYIRIIDGKFVDVADMKTSRTVWTGKDGENSVKQAKLGIDRGTIGSVKEIESNK